MKTIGLFFGSFNPVHIGHLLIARRMKEATQMNEVWMVISPQNPFKQHLSLLEDVYRLRLMELALKEAEDIRVCDIEFSLPKPSYTIYTLNALKEKHPDIKFEIIMGEDNLNGFTGWKDYKKIVDEHPIHVYCRNAEKINNERLLHHNIIIHQLPLMDISSTEIRKRIKEGKDITWMVPDKVKEEIHQHQWYFS